MIYGEDDQRLEAMTQLMDELNAGLRSAKEEGWVSEDEFKNHFYERSRAEEHYD